MSNAFGHLALLHRLIYTIVSYYASALWPHKAHAKHGCVLQLQHFLPECNGKVLRLSYLHKVVAHETFTALGNGNRRLGVGARKIFHFEHGGLTIAVQRNIAA